MRTPSRSLRVPVDQSIIQWVYNESVYPELIRQGTLRVEVLDDRVLKDPGTSPLGTRSQVLRYYNDAGTLFLDVHQRLHPDGTIGGGGKPDPQRGFVQEVFLLVEGEQMP